MIPEDVLIRRAMSYFERAELELAAGWTTSAADFIEKGIALLKEVLERP